MRLLVLALSVRKYTPGFDPLLWIVAIEAALPDIESGAKLNEKLPVRLPEAPSRVRELEEKLCIDSFSEIWLWLAMVIGVSEMVE